MYKPVYSQVAIDAAAKQQDRAIRFDNNGMKAATANGCHPTPIEW